MCAKFSNVPGVTIDKGLDLLRDKLSEKEKEVERLKREVKELDEQFNDIALKNIKLRDKNKKASKIIADLKRQDKISDINALEEEIIRLLKENKRLENKISLVKEML